jgi:hypothetical protein
MTAQSVGIPDDVVSYSYRPSVLGAGWRFALTDDGLAWEFGRRSGCVPYRDVKRLRMSFRPLNMQTQRYMTELWSPGAPKLRIVSVSWKSMVEQERLDKTYSAFVRALHRRIADAGAAARFEQGSHPLLYWPGLVVFAGVALGFAGLIVRALQTGALSGAAFIGAFLALLLWQGGMFFRRNRPGLYRLDALPAAVMPKE